MSKKFDIISFVLMIILILMLFIVVHNYFTNSSTIVTNLDSSNINTPNNIIYSGDKNSVIISSEFESGNTLGKNEQSIIDTETNNNQNVHESVQETKDNNFSGEYVTDAKSGEQIRVNQNVPTATESTPVIMTSADDISNKEKKEVLKELDQTLMELLEIVDSVQTIDETRLINEEGEVQE